jgi:peroxiredoxin
VQFIGVAWTGSDERFQGFIDQYGLTFPQISDDAGDVYARFGIPYQPSLVIVTADGEVQTVSGAVDATTLDGLLRQAVA